MSGIEASLASGLLKVAGDKLVALIASEFAAITGVKKDLSELQYTHGEITSWLSTVRDLSIENDPRFGWVIKLKDVAYDIDDLLYEVHLQAEKHEMGRDRGKIAMAGCFCAKPKSFLFRCKMAQKIKAIQVKFAAIAKQRSDMNAISHNLPVNQRILSRNRATGELSLLTNVEESEIPTRDQERGKVVCKLLESNEGEDGWIVSVVGLGGSGKTTLAKHICHDSSIKERFKDKIYWVHVSQEFDVKKLIGKLFEAITKEKSDLHTPQHMVDEISRKLIGEKFLLVLDDAWHQDKEDWKELMVNLRTRAAGSKVMITTRDQKVAEAVKSDHIFYLAYLSEAESWSLFLKSSGWADEDLGSDFIHVGKEIVNKCGGVPLAIKTLGGILSEKNEISTWRAIKQSDLWNEESTEARVFASLKLSYIHLKDHLKQCFTFCCIFPKGCRINKNYLIEQWIAHGFIKQIMDEQPVVTGNEYFNSLVKVGFFQDSLEIGDANRVLFKMHDLIHELIRYILQSDVVTSLPKNMTKDCTQKCRYLSLTSCGENDDRIFFDKVRALYVSGGNPSLDELVKKSRYIYSVVLNCAINTPFPLFILKLDYLGYLEIRNVSCTKLPESISGCWNLQSLHFIDCIGFVTLPMSIGKLKKLRTLGMIYCVDLETLPQSIGDCRNLQSLQIETCGKLRKIPNTIGGNENLRILQIVSCKELQQLSSDLIGEVSSIETINLARCSSLQGLPSTFSSRTLRTLNLSQTRVTTLPEWVTLIGTLECINLYYCSELVELPRGIGNLRKLEVLDIRLCWKLRLPSEFGQLTRLRRLGLFVVGCGEDDARISDLGNLDMISGEMEFRDLQYVESPGDAEKAYLKQKRNIQDLTLRWSSGGIMEEGSLSEMEQDLAVLDALEPPSEIMYLKIDGYRGSHIPCWMRKPSDSSYLEGVVLRQTRASEYLCLTLLILKNFPNLKHMKGLLVLPSLKSLYLKNMPNLEELWTTSGSGVEGEEVGGGRCCFPVLSHLQVVHCPKFILRPFFPPLLKSLELRRSNNQLLSPSSSFVRRHPTYADDEASSSGRVIAPAAPQLKRLKLKAMAGSSPGWEFLQHLAGLETLCISCCSLRELPESMRGLTSLRRLEIFSSYIAVLPEWLGELHSLQHLEVLWCRKMSSIPQSIGHLKSLVTLNITDWVNLKQLPETMQHLASLQELALAGCSALTALPEGIGQLSALQSLLISDCPALQSLPSSIQYLTSLKRLEISRCSELARRCKKEVGNDWHLISHIPHVNISDGS